MVGESCQRDSFSLLSYITPSLVTSRELKPAYELCLYDVVMLNVFTSSSMMLLYIPIPPY